MFDPEQFLMEKEAALVGRFTLLLKQLQSATEQRMLRWVQHPDDSTEYHGVFPTGPDPLRRRVCLSTTAISMAQLHPGSVWREVYRVDVSEITGQADDVLSLFTHLYEAVAMHSSDLHQGLVTVLSGLDGFQKHLQSVLDGYSPEDAPVEDDVEPGDGLGSLSVPLDAPAAAEEEVELTEASLAALASLPEVEVVKTDDMLADAAALRDAFDEKNREAQEKMPPAQISFEESALAQTEAVVEQARAQAAAGVEPGQGGEAVDTIPGQTPLVVAPRPPERWPEDGPGPDSPPEPLSSPESYPKQPTSGVVKKRVAAKRKKVRRKKKPQAP